MIDEKLDNCEKIEEEILVNFVKILLENSEPAPDWADQIFFENWEDLLL